MLTLILILMFGAPQQAAAQPMAVPSSAEVGVADARAAAEAVEVLEAEDRAAMCREAREAKGRITAAAIRLGERDPDLMRAWAAADRIERLAC